MFLSWYDADKKKPARQKLSDGIERYAEKFGTAPETCLTNPVDATALAADGKAAPIPVRAVSYIPRWTFYIGVEDEPAARAAA